MIIDFREIKETVVEKMRGGENYAKLNRLDIDNKMIARITLDPNSSIGYHTHVDDEEIIYVISGEGKCIDNGEELVIKTGQVNYVPRGKSHSIINNSDKELVLLAIILK